MDEKEISRKPFERYADDVVVHCRTEEEAVKLKRSYKGKTSGVQA